MLNIGSNRMAFHNSMLFKDVPSNTLGAKNPPNSVVNELYFLLKPYIPGHECLFHRDILPLYNQVVTKEKNVSYDSLISLVAEVAGGVVFVNENLVSLAQTFTSHLLSVKQDLLFQPQWPAACY